MEGVEELVAAEALLAAIVRAGGSRHVVASAVAALWRAFAERGQGSPGGSSIDLVELVLAEVA